jgi:KaiC/GvpD/RAD55 family RecA-like ATPase
MAIWMNYYTFGIKELDDIIGGLKKGTNILLIGPPMSGKEAISNHMMYHGATENENAVILLTTHEPAIHILERFKENKLNVLLSKVGIVDCVSKMLGGEAVETENIKIVSNPVDLTGIGVKISQFFEDFLIKKNIRKIQLHIDSLSTILMYSNIQTVFRFLHVFTGRIKAAEALGMYVIDSGMHDEHAIATLKQLCDGMIEVKSENDRNFMRIVGLVPKPTPWLEFEVDGANRIIVREKHLNSPLKST